MFFILDLIVTSQNNGLPKKEIFHGKEIPTKYLLHMQIIYSIMIVRIVKVLKRYLPFQPFLRPGSAPFKS